MNCPHCGIDMKAATATIHAKGPRQRKPRVNDVVACSCGGWFIYNGNMDLEYLSEAKLASLHPLTRATVDAIRGIKAPQ